MKSALQLLLAAAVVTAKTKKCTLPVGGSPNSTLPQTPHVLKEYMLPMSDGVKLHTFAATPLHLFKKKYPTVIDRSPYGMFNTELLADVFLAFGFAAVSQDMRGTCKSEGTFTLWHKDREDGAETLKWITEQPWSDGRVYEIGASADGIAGFTLARASPPSLKAQFQIFATAEARRTIFPGGAFRSGLTEGWLKGTVHEQAPALLKLIHQKEAPSPWWDAVEIKGDQYRNVTWPSVHWAGWYDIFLHGHLYSYDGYQHRSAPKVRGKHYLVVDPCGHCQDAASYFPKHLVVGRALLPLLLGVRLFRETTKVPEGVKAITFYVMGAKGAPKGDGNYWTSLDTWPEPTPTPLYLADGGKLRWERDSVADLRSWEAGGSADDTGVGKSKSSVSWKYDPANPTPTIGGNNLELACGPLDQRPVEARKDVAVFSSPVLKAPLALTGPLEAVLHVSTRSAINDTDFAIKLTDVYPDGTSRLIQDGIQRMRWRAGPYETTPLPMVANVTYQINISMWNTSYVFSAGHVIRAVVSSANAPRFRPNPNTGLPLALEDGRKLVAENVVHFSSHKPSALLLPVVELSQLPEHNILATVDKMVDEAAAEAHVDSSVLRQALEDIAKDEIDRS